MRVRVDKITPEILAIRIVEMLERYAKLRPDANIKIHIPYGDTFCCKFSETTFHTNNYKDIVIDAEKL